jgi:hypothetical protein
LIDASGARRSWETAATSVFARRATASVSLACKGLAHAIGLARRQGRSWLAKSSSGSRFWLDGPSPDRTSKSHRDVRRRSRPERGDRRARSIGSPTCRYSLVSGTRGAVLLPSGEPRAGNDLKTASFGRSSATWVEPKTSANAVTMTVREHVEWFVLDEEMGELEQLSDLAGSVDALWPLWRSSWPRPWRRAASRRRTRREPPSSVARRPTSVR